MGRKTLINVSSECRKDLLSLLTAVVRPTTAVVGPTTAVHSLLILTSVQPNNMIIYTQLQVYIKVCNIAI